MSDSASSRAMHADFVLQLQNEILIVLQAIYRFKLANSFPDGKDEATFEEISQRSGLSVSYVQRILRHAITYRIFCEPRKGTIAHTAASLYFANNSSMREWVGMVCEEMWPAASKAGFPFHYIKDALLSLNISTDTPGRRL